MIDNMKDNSKNIVNNITMKTSNVFSPKGIIRFSARKRRNNDTDSNDNNNSSIHLSNDDMVRVMITVMIVIRITTCMYVSSLNYGVKHVFI